MTAQSKTMTRVGWVLTGLVGAFMILASAAPKFMSPAMVEELMRDKLGWPADLRLTVGVLEVACTLVFLVPRTAVLGAVLMTGYLGGATATHVRIHDNFIAPVVVGVCLWLALYLREARVRTLLPLRTDPQPAGDGRAT